VSLPTTWILLLPLEAAPSAQPVYPSGSSGFASYIVGGFLILGILVLFMVWTSRKPRARRRP